MKRRCKRTQETLDFLRNLAKRYTYLTTHPTSEEFYLFSERFFPEEKNIDKIRNRMRYYLNLLVKEGFLLKCVREGCDYDLTGAKTMGIWEINRSCCKRLFLPNRQENFQRIQRQSCGNSYTTKRIYGLRSSG